LNSDLKRSLSFSKKAKLSVNSSWYWFFNLVKCAKNTCKNDYKTSLEGYKNTPISKQIGVLMAIY